MKCSQCKCKVDKDKLIVSGIKYFCSSNCYMNYMDGFKVKICSGGKSSKSYLINSIGQKKKERLASEGSESSLFKKRYEQLKHKGEHRCMVTGCILTEDMLSPASFPHILPKGKYPALRYFTNNIGLVKGIKEHDIFDTYVNNYKIKYGTINLENDIKNGKEVYYDILKFNEGFYE